MGHGKCTPGIRTHTHKLSPIVPFAACDFGVSRHKKNSARGVRPWRLSRPGIVFFQSMLGAAAPAESVWYNARTAAIALDALL
jgi:hypothetical protein